MGPWQLTANAKRRPTPKDRQRQTSANAKWPPANPHVANQLVPGQFVTYSWLDSRLGKVLVQVFGSGLGKVLVQISRWYWKRVLH